MERTTLWSRVGQWFKSTSRSEGLSNRSATGETSAPGPGSDGGTASAAAATSLSKVRLGRSSAGLERLEEEYARVVKLIESVQSHLEQQGLRSEHMVGSLGRLADSLSHLPEASKTQLELLSTISHQMGVDGACARRLEETLSQLPQIADAQRETMVSIGRQLDLSRGTTERVVSTLEGFQREITRVGDTTNETAKALERIRWDALARDERLATILREQTKRLTVFAVAAMALAVVAAAAGVVALTQ